MSKYEKQVHAIGRRNDAEIRALESQGIEVLSSKVAGRRLHEKIHNPWDEGIDEG
jgi:biotin operon repressor